MVSHQNEILIPFTDRRRVFSGVPTQERRNEGNGLYHFRVENGLIQKSKNRTRHSRESGNPETHIVILNEVKNPFFSV